jgi:hypothetical protein
MHSMRNTITAFAVAAFALPGAVAAQNLEAGLRVTQLRAEPAELNLTVGQVVPLKVVALDEAGNPVDAQLRISAPRGTIDVDDGQVTGERAGQFTITAVVALPPDAGREPVTLSIPVTVSWPAVQSVEITGSDGNRLWVGASLDHDLRIMQVDGTERPDDSAQWSISNPEVAAVDRWGNITVLDAGSFTLTASVDNRQATRQYEAAVFPARSLQIDVAEDRVRTGDVVHLGVRATTADGSTTTDAPVSWTFTFTPDDSIAAPGAAGLIQDGRFVAEVPGQYTLIASTGATTARRVIDVRPRQVVEEIEVSGHGEKTGYNTSDLWIFEGVDGRDYAVTGTHGGAGWAYFWDVTGGNVTKTDSIQVDARTVNDVKVSPDGRYAALSREGASNRRNGVVILDLANPAHPTIASTYDQVDGGVHNMFATDDYLFALDNGDKYVIIDVRDLSNPTFVSEYNHPDSRIHDVWVHDGVAYSSEWGTGVVVVDVGNGKWGGTIEKPVFVTNVPYPVGRTHAAFPYHQEATGRFYLFLGDEILNRRGAAWSGASAGRLSVTSGYYHIIDFTDPENPKDVARYEVPEFGTHNLWVEDDRLYSGYYEGGLRVVDVSGELMGNLANQGREIAVFKAFDPDGQRANMPFAWGAQPYKGFVFFSDYNSGLWSVKLTPRTRPIS